MDKAKTLHPYSESPFVAVLRTLVDARGVMAMDLAKKIEISAVALSNIMTGQSWPRKKTFEKLINELCMNAAEAQLLRNTYTSSIVHKGVKIPTGSGFDLEAIPTDKRAKVAHVKAKMEMARRARQRGFQHSLRAALDCEAIPYEADYLVGDILIDFLIRFTFEEEVEAREVGDPEGVFLIERQIALICERDPDAKPEAMRAMVSFIQASLPVDEAIVVVPHTETTPYRCFSKRPNPVLTDRWVLKHLKQLKESAVASPADV